jgi:peroxisomal enoyl-CoA hydratase 2
VETYKRIIGRITMIKKELAGKKFSEFDFPVERGKIKEFSKGICDPNPIYRDSAYARKQGFDDVITPVTFPATIAFHHPADNYMVENAQKLGMDITRSVHGESEFILYRPVCAGETLRAESTIGDIYEKEGKRGGTMTFVEMITNFYDAEGKLVIIFNNVFIQRG